MDLRRLGWYVGEAVAIAAFGVSLLGAGAWLLSRLARKYGTDPTPMGTTVQTFEKLSPAAYDAVHADAKRRLAALSYRQRQSAQIASGVEPAESKQIRIVR